MLTGRYRDQIYGEDGAVRFDSGPRSNQIVDAAGEILASLLRGGPDAGPIRWIALGAGDPRAAEGWRPGPEIRKLLDERQRYPVGAGQMSWLDARGAPSETPTATLQVQVSVRIDAALTLREFGLYGGAASGEANSGTLFNHVHHAALTLRKGERLVRTLTLRFGEAIAAQAAYEAAHPSADQPSAARSPEDRARAEHAAEARIEAERRAEAMAAAERAAADRSPSERLSADSTTAARSSGGRTAAEPTTSDRPPAEPPPAAPSARRDGPGRAWAEEAAEASLASLDLFDARAVATLRPTRVTTVGALASLSTEVDAQIAALRAEAWLILEVAGALQAPEALGSWTLAQVAERGSTAVAQAGGITEAQADVLCEQASVLLAWKTRADRPLTLGAIARPWAGGRARWPAPPADAPLGARPVAHLRGVPAALARRLAVLRPPSLGALAAADLREPATGLAALPTEDQIQVARWRARARAMLGLIAALRVPAAAASQRVDALATRPRAALATLLGLPEDQAAQVQGVLGLALQVRGVAEEGVTVAALVGRGGTP